MIAFRKAHSALAKGSLTIVEARDDYIAIIREIDGNRIFAAFNLSAMAQPVKLPQGEWRQDKGAPFRPTVNDRGITLPPWQAYFAVAD